MTAGATVYAALWPRQGWAQSNHAPKGLSKLVTGEPRPLPDTAFTDAEGKPMSFADFSGKGLIVNFWATWCAPCVAEMPALDKTQAALGSQGLAVLALSSDRAGKSQVEAFYKRNGIHNLPILLDPRGAAARAFGARGLPTSVLVDRRGQEVARLEGEAEWDHPEWLAKVKELALA
ncbi:TlpA family protein disulfide reductase [Acetobacteraceae bacterium H6797]|nr:TlpA family protein disulfide reductase [Acetobacteraceae bacterium H6797]